MSETNTIENGNVEASGDTGSVEKGNTFTQAEVDTIVANRVARESSKVSKLTDDINVLSKAFTELKEASDTSAATISELTEKLRASGDEKIKLEVALETGVEPDKLDAFKWETKEDLKKAVDNWKPSGSTGSNFFNGKDYEDKSPTRLANRILKQYSAR